MKRLLCIFLLSLLSTIASAESSAPRLDYVPVPDSFTLPVGMNFGSVSGVAINSKGHIFVLNRGP
jgi:hypothetical protein